VLYQREAHEPLVDDRWDASRVRGAVRAVAADAEDTFDDAGPPIRSTRRRAGCAASTSAAPASSTRSAASAGAA
jgi:hypothetical protein